MRTVRLKRRNCHEVTKDPGSSRSSHQNDIVCRSINTYSVALVVRRFPHSGNGAPNAPFQILFQCKSNRGQDGQPKELATLQSRGERFVGLPPSNSLERPWVSSINRGTACRSRIVLCYLKSTESSADEPSIPCNSHFLDNRILCDSCLSMNR
jgi:hypothetical protein